jgi:hypothetical protein
VSDNERALTSEVWRQTLTKIASDEDATHNERVLARLLLDVLRLGDAPIQRWFDEQGLRIMEEGRL